MGDDLVAFLKARLDEDEASARKALALWPDTHFTVEPGSLVIVGFHRAHDPARVLREVEAKQAIVATYERQFTERKAHPGDLAVSGALLALHGTVKHLAAVYSGHLGYRPEWKP